jgi:uncharacterized protein (TIGR02996 family)
MSEEDAFQTKLDMAWDDHTTRLVFADWLEEREDPRAEGYRALGLFRSCPCNYGPQCEWWAWDTAYKHLECDLPCDWWDMIDCKPDLYHCSMRSFPSRRDAEDAAALAWLKLSPERREEILKTA